MLIRKGRYPYPLYRARSFIAVFSDFFSPLKSVMSASFQRNVLTIVIHFSDLVN